MREHEGAALDAHVELVLRTYWAIRAYGFTRIVALAGHYPNVRALSAAAVRFHVAQSLCQVIWGTERDLSQVPGGDHAGPYETAQLLRLKPELVHLDDLPEGEALGGDGTRSTGSDIRTRGPDPARLHRSHARAPWPASTDGRDRCGR